jgi:hypothetical protein
VGGPRERAGSPNGDLNRGGQVFLKQWVTERFTEAEIKADPSLRITTLRR